MDEAKAKIIRYASLAARNLQETGSAEPTEEMKKLADEIGLSHNQIIQQAAELTLGPVNTS